MDAATIQAKVYYGYAKSAQYVGQTFNHYRPQSGQPIIGSATLLGSLNAGMTPASASGFNFNKAGLDTNYFWACLADGTQLQVGDVLQDAAQTFFIAAMQPLLPMVAILANATITIKRPQVPSVFGAVGYQGLTEATETTLISGLPAAIRVASSGKNTRGQELPADAPGPDKYTLFFSATLLGSPPVMERDVIYDGMGRRFQVSGLEMTPVGPKVDAVRLLA